jgi:hypothetical protein
LQFVSNGERIAKFIASLRDTLIQGGLLDAIPHDSDKGTPVSKINLFLTKFYPENGGILIVKQLISNKLMMNKRKLLTGLILYKSSKK